jgi:hypothetical protein
LWWLSVLCFLFVVAVLEALAALRCLPLLVFELFSVSAVVLPIQLLPPTLLLLTLHAFYSRATA